MLLVTLTSYGQWTDRTNGVTITKKLGVGINNDPFATLEVYDPNFTYVNIFSEPNGTNGAILQLGTKWPDNVLTLGQALLLLGSVYHLRTDLY